MSLPPFAQLDLSHPHVALMIFKALHLSSLFVSTETSDCALRLSGQASRCRRSSLPFITSLLARAERYSESVMLEVSLCAWPDQMRWALMFGGGPSRSSSSDPISDPVVDTCSGVRTLIPLWPVTGRDSDPCTNSGQQQMPSEIRAVDILTCAHHKEFKCSISWATAGSDSKSLVDSVGLCTDTDFTIWFQFTSSWFDIS